VQWEIRILSARSSAPRSENLRCAVVKSLNAESEFAATAEKGDPFLLQIAPARAGKIKEHYLNRKNFCKKHFAWKFSQE
jgi:hypothetical protein